MDRLSRCSSPNLELCLTEAGAQPARSHPAPRPHGTFDMITEHRSTIVFMPRRAARAFTLIELLVVIAIVSLLVGIMLPALKETRDAARQVACAARLGQASLVMTVYEMDNREVFPRIQDASYGMARPSWDPAQAVEKTWVDLLCELRYIDANPEVMGVPQMLRCPSAEYENDPSWAGLMPHFAINVNLSPPRRLEATVGQRSFFGRPSSFVGSRGSKLMMVESRHLDNPRGWFSAGNFNWIALRHGRSRASNAAYLDGSIALRTVGTDLTVDDAAHPFAKINFWRQAEQ